MPGIARSPIRKRATSNSTPLHPGRTHDIRNIRLSQSNTGSCQSHSLACTPVTTALFFLNDPLRFLDPVKSCCWVHPVSSTCPRLHFQKASGYCTGGRLAVTSRLQPKRSANGPVGWKRGTRGKKHQQLRFGFALPTFAYGSECFTGRPEEVNSEHPSSSTNDCWPQNGQGELANKQTQG